MKRLNVQAAFIGEPSSSHEGLDAQGDDEAVIVAVRGGELTFVVPAGTPDERVTQDTGIVRGALRLENGRVFTFEIHDGADGAFFEDESAQLYRERERQLDPGLSSIRGADAFAAGGAVQAQHIMTTSVISIAPGASIDDAAQLMAFYDISGLPVVEGDRLVGIVSETDLISKQGRNVGEIMNPEVVAVAEDTALAEIARTLAEKKVRRVPVMRGERLVGVVSQSDIVRWAATH